MRNRPAFIDQLIYDENLSSSEERFVFWIFDVSGAVLIGVAILISFFFIINMFLFTKLLNNRFDSQTQHKVFMYQIIWGVFNIVINQGAGIAYLISGLQGINLYKENKLKEIDDYERFE